MKLRKLKNKDAEKILEWIKNPEIGGQFRFDAAKMDINTVLNFIEKSQSETSNLHMAVIDEFDNYLGTVSLKNINLNDQNAEYAIVMHKSAIGTGAAKFATEEIIKTAFTQLNLKRIYLNVFSDNLRAIKFYEKIGFKYEGELKKHVKIRDEFKDLKLFSLLGCVDI